MVSILAVLSGCRSKKELSASQQAVQKEEIKAAATDYHDASTWLIGYFTRRMMTMPPHSEWFRKGYDEYKFNEDAVNKLTTVSKDSITIKIVMGSWCPDSRREVPGMMRILDYWGFPEEKITFIGVDESKFSPIGGYEKLEIVRVPTFIFYKNNIELGRIIENPVTSLEQDMTDILAKE